MYFESFAHVPITEELLRHVWDGEEDPAKGGHRYGLCRDGKTEFPQTWDRAMVEYAIVQVLESPQSVRIRGAEITCLRQVGDVIVKVKLSFQAQRPRIVFVAPVCGDGVFRNDNGRRVPLPLDLSRLEA